MAGPYSAYISRDLHSLGKFSWLPKTEPPNQTAYLCTMFWKTLQDMDSVLPDILEKAAMRWFKMPYNWLLRRVSKPLKRVEPPERTMFSYNLIRYSMGQD